MQNPNDITFFFLSCVDLRYLRQRQDNPLHAATPRQAYGDLHLHEGIHIPSTQLSTREFNITWFLSILIWIVPNIQPDNPVASGITDFNRTSYEGWYCISECTGTWKNVEQALNMS
jgi:hypothetical protein